MSKDYYEVLGVNKNSTKGEIKSEYRKLAKKYHPDVNPDDPEAEARFKEASEAYETLSDENKKGNYDRFGSSNGDSYDRPGGRSGFEEFFSNFGGGGGFNVDDLFGQFTNRRSGRNDGLRVRVSLSLSEIITGTTKKIRYQRDIECNSCNGLGGKNVDTCGGCGGSGQKIYTQNTPIGMVRQASACNQCNGEGHIIKDKCTRCRGTGTEKRDEVVDIELPKGSIKDMAMKMQQMGSYQKGRGYGDLLISIDETPDQRFTRHNLDIRYNEEISIVDAILGCDRTITMPHGDEIKFNISSGTSHGQMLRVRGRGISDINYGSVGSLLIDITIKIPTNLSNDEKAIIEKLKQLDIFK